MRLNGDDGRIWEVAEPAVHTGGQGMVYASTDGRFAVKVALAGHEVAVRRERDELRRLLREQAGLDRALVPVVGGGEDPEHGPFLVMPWIATDALRWLTHTPPRHPGEMAEPLKAPRTLLDRLRLAEACASALATLHWIDGERHRLMDYRYDDGRVVRGKVIHRDVKPQNFLVEDPRGDVVARLSDFGATSRTDFRTVSCSTVVFTVGYAPIEQLLPRQEVPDVSRDVYAMGATLYHLLVGHPPVGTALVENALTEEGGRLRDARNALFVNPASVDDLGTRDKLARLPLLELVNLAKLTPLREGDVTDLRAAFNQGLAEMGLPAGVATGLVDPLLSHLRQALDPDPASRETDARELRNAVRNARGRLERALAEGVAPSVSAPPLRQSTVDLRARPGPAAQPHPPLPDSPPQPPLPEPRPLPTGDTADHETARSRHWMPLGLVGATGAVGCLVAVVLAGSAGVAWWQAGSPVPTPAAPAVSDPFPMATVAAGSHELRLDGGATYTVNLSHPLVLGAEEVTQAWWAALMGENPMESRQWRSDAACNAAGLGGDLPVTCVSWVEALQFCNALTAQVNEDLPETARLTPAYREGGDGRWRQVPEATGYRLPTEAEWAVAAQEGGTDWAGGADPATVAWTVEHSGSTLHRSRELTGTATGFFGLSGNAAEWVWDGWADSPSGGSDPTGPAVATDRVVRGGAFPLPADKAKATARDKRPADTVHWMIGLRVGRRG